MLTYCAMRVVEMFGADWTEDNAQWWVWMFGCVEPCHFCDKRQ